MGSAYSAIDENCFATNIDIDGNYFRSNIVTSIKNVYSQQDCQRHCREWERQGCEYFVFENANNKCRLFHDIEKIEYDADSAEKYVGWREACLPCFRKGWDYVITGSGNNIAGHGYIEQVPSVKHCAVICTQVDGCKYVSWHKEDQLCYLKDKDAREGMDNEDGYQSASIETCPSLNQDCRYLNVLTTTTFNIKIYI